ARAPFLVLHLEGQSPLVDGAGVVLEAADNRLVDSNPIVVPGRSHKLGDFRKLFLAGSSCVASMPRSSGDRRDDACDLRIQKLRAFCKIAAFVLASLAEQHFDAVDSQPI